MTNTESHPLPHAMREQARRLGWREGHIAVVEAELGRSAPSPVGWDG